MKKIILISAIILRYADYGGYRGDKHEERRYENNGHDNGVRDHGRGHGRKDREDRD